MDDSQLGTQSLAIIYAVFSLANFVSPIIVHYLGARFCMFLVCWASLEASKIFRLFSLAWEKLCPFPIFRSFLVFYFSSSIHIHIIKLMNSLVRSPHLWNEGWHWLFPLHRFNLNFECSSDSFSFSSFGVFGSCNLDSTGFSLFL